MQVVEPLNHFYSLEHIYSWQTYTAQFDSERSIVRRQMDVLIQNSYIELLKTREAFTILRRPRTPFAISHNVFSGRKNLARSLHCTTSRHTIYIPSRFFVLDYKPSGRLRMAGAHEDEPSPSGFFSRVFYTLDFHTRNSVTLRVVSIITRTRNQTRKTKVPWRRFLLGSGAVVAFLVNYKRKSEGRIRSFARTHKHTVVCALQGKL